MSARAKMTAVAVVTVLLAGCGVQVPTDPHGTLERVEDGVLHAGATANAPWVEVDPSGIPTGSEPALVQDFAQQLGSEVEWTVGSEAELVAALERGDLDVVVGGFRDDTPWVDKAAVTRPYAETTTPDGTEKHVMITRMGENGFLVALETYLHGAVTP